MKYLTTTVSAVLMLISVSAQMVPQAVRPVSKMQTITQPIVHSGIQGKDLTISIKNLIFDPANGSNLTATYVVKNNGSEAVDVNNVTLAGYIDGPLQEPLVTVPNAFFNGKNYYPGGGHVIASSPTVLVPGQEMEGTLRCFNLSKSNYFNNSNNYKYLLALDKNNVVAEANENNNVVSADFRGYAGRYAPSVPSAQYYLTDAFVIIRTGSDNKERESEVNFRLMADNAKNPGSDNGNEYVGKIAKNMQEFSRNGTTQHPLNLFMSGTSYTVNPATSLAAFQQKGMGLLIEYKANFPLDVWRIDGLEIALAFKDANEVYHPTEGFKKIRVNLPANTMLDGFGKKFLAIKTDAAFNPISVRTIEKASDF